MDINRQKNESIILPLLRSNIIEKTTKMGIRYLNKYLRTNCPNSIKNIHLSNISGKRVAVDISIYLYKFESENALIKNMYQMLCVFRKYNILPVFIFDGKPPPEKNALLQKRKEDKVEAQEEYNRLKQRLEEDSKINGLDKDKEQIEEDKDINKDKEQQEDQKRLDEIKKQFTKVSKEKVEKVKSLIRAYGATYFDADGEADELCALLVIQRKVWACLSEDMDLFVYGCTKVIRYFDLLNHTAVLYYTKGILNELRMSQKEFKEVCVLSGTDYNISDRSVDLMTSLRYFRKYRKSFGRELSFGRESSFGRVSFYDWLLKNTQIITNMDLLLKTVQMFSFENVNPALLNIKVFNGPIRQKELDAIVALG